MFPTLVPAGQFPYEHVPAASVIIGVYATVHVIAALALLYGLIASRSSA